jgi:pimeloyl-ACP methyl ester carboxylesterase
MLQAFAGGRLFGERYGTASPTVVALHGWGRAHSDFDAVLRGLDAVAFDLPGFGATPPPAEVWGSEDYADAVAAGIDQPAVVLGHSLGGRVATHLAARRPDLVRGLVLTAAPLVRVGNATSSRPALRYRVTRALHRRGLVGDARMEQLRQRYGSADYRAAQGVMRGIHVRLVNENYDDAIAAIRCPVELVWGSDDAETPLAVAHALTQRLPDARLTVVEGAGHMTPQTATDVLRDALARLL